MATPGSDRSRVLVADDQPDVREALRLLLKSEGYAADLVESPAQVLTAVRARPYAALLFDLNYTRDTTWAARASPRCRKSWRQTAICRSS